MASWTVDYPGAIQVEAANYGYSTKNNPKGFVYHTPEEKADDDPQTPRYLAGTTKLASYHYFVSYLGFVFQLVPESEGAYANYVTAGKTYPIWSSSSINLNLQSLSISFEGEAHNIHLTMPRGSPQWKAGVELVAHRAKELNINPDNWSLHKYVSIYRNDPGSLDINTFTQDVILKIEEDDMPTLDEIQVLLDKHEENIRGSFRGEIIALILGNYRSGVLGPSGNRDDPDFGKWVDKMQGKHLKDVMDKLVALEAKFEHLNNRINSLHDKVNAISISDGATVDEIKQAFRDVLSNLINILAEGV